MVSYSHQSHVQEGSQFSGLNFGSLPKIVNNLWTWFLGVLQNVWMILDIPGGKCLSEWFTGVLQDARGGWRTLHQGGWLPCGHRGKVPHQSFFGKVLLGFWTGTFNSKWNFLRLVCDWVWLGWVSGRFLLTRLFHQNLPFPLHPRCRGWSLLWSSTETFEQEQQDPSCSPRAERNGFIFSSDIDPNCTTAHCPLFLPVLTDPVTFYFGT